MIRVMKIVTGEDLVSEVVETDGNYILKSPAQIIMQPTERGMSVGLVPYMPYSKGDVTLNADQVVSVADADPELENEYRRLFGSGLVVAQAGSIG